MTYSILRLKGPLVSFGSVRMSAKREPTAPAPRLSMVCGLIANALGIDRSESERLQELQSSIEYAAREDVRPEVLSDYQTADLGSDVLYGTNWTTHDRVEERGGSNNQSTEQRYRDYLAGGVYTVALRSSLLSTDEIEEAFLRPMRPLFIGRKSCLPSAPMYRGVMEGSSPVDALMDAPFDDAPPDACRVWHEAPDGDETYDRRNWKSQAFTASRKVKETTLFF